MFHLNTLLFAAAIAVASPLASAQTSYVDSFESATLNPFWSATTTSGAMIAGSTSRYHDGVRSLEFQSTQTSANKYIEVRHAFAAPVFGTTTVWVWDRDGNAGSSNYIGLFATTAANLGVAVYAFDYNLSSSNGGSYVFNTPGQGPTHSTVARSTGWHRFSISSTPTALTFCVDQTTVYTGPGGHSLKDVYLYMGGPSWRPAWTCNFDEFSFFQSGIGQSNSACASLQINGQGSLGNGPFALYPNTGALTLDWSGAPNMPFVLLASGRMAPGQVVLGNVAVDLELASSVPMMNGLDPITGWLYRTSALGTAKQVISIPSAMLGVTMNFQGVVLDLYGACASNPGMMTTAAFAVSL